MTSTVDEETCVIINDKVQYFRMEMPNTALYSWVVAASFIAVIILSPILSGIADYSGSKKKFLRFFCYLGSLACMGLYFFSDEYQIMFWVSGAVYLSCVALEFAFIAKRYMEATVPIFGQVAAAPSMNMASALLMSATFLAVNFMFSMLTGLVLQKTLAET